MLIRVFSLGTILGLLYFVCIGMLPELAIIPVVATFLLMLGYAWVDADLGERYDAGHED